MAAQPGHPPPHGHGLDQPGASSGPRRLRHAPTPDGVGAGDLRACSREGRRRAHGLPGQPGDAPAPPRATRGHTRRLGTPCASRAFSRRPPLDETPSPAPGGTDAGIARRAACPHGRAATPGVSLVHPRRGARTGWQTTRSARRSYSGAVAGNVAGRLQYCLVLACQFPLHMICREEAERQVSAAAESRSDAGADAVSGRLHTLVRPGLPPEHGLPCFAHLMHRRALYRGLRWRCQRRQCHCRCADCHEVDEARQVFIVQGDQGSPCFARYRRIDCICAAQSMLGSQGEGVERTPRPVL